MQKNPFTTATSSALKSMGLETNDQNLRSQLERIKEERANLDRARVAALKRAEQTHAYRDEVMELLDATDQDVSTLNRLGLLPAPLHGMGGKHMFDRRAIDALLTFRAALREVE